MTVLANSLGAPFWFDLLDRLTIVHGGKAPEEKPKLPGKSSPRSDPTSLRAKPGVSTPCVQLVASIG